MTFAHPGKIQTVEGKWNETCVTEDNFTENQLKKPGVRSILEYADQRMLSTLLTSGSMGPNGLGYVPTKVGMPDESAKLGNNTYQFHLQGRIQRPSAINSQIGSSGTDGSFTLSMKDNMLVPGMNALFNGQGFQARVQSAPTGGVGNFIYHFQSPDGVVFDWTTHVAGQSGEKTCFGGYTSYSEKSLRGYGRTFTPDAFITHMGIQRKSVAISGGAGSTVLWIEYDSPSGPVKGWRYEEERQAKIQFQMEAEYKAWFGVSTMKDANGKLLTRSRIQDQETGLDIIDGDGILTQIAGGNEFVGSGTDGMATAADHEDMMRQLEQKSNGYSGMTWVCVTGTDGYAKAQRVMPLLSANQNTTYFQNVTQTGEAGGAKVDAGFNFTSFNVNGNKVWFVKHPMFDDETRFTERGANGKTLQSGMYVYLNLGGQDGKKNMERMCKAANGINRSLVEGYINGMTGDPSKTIMSEEDAIKYMMLKEDLTVIYNTSTCGIIHQAAA